MNEWRECSQVLVSDELAPVGQSGASTDTGVFKLDVLNLFRCKTVLAVTFNEERSEIS